MVAKPRVRWKKLLVNLVKFGISLGIIAWLLLQAQRDKSFAELRDQPKHWGMLSLAGALAFAAVCITFVRWCLLVRALGLRFRLKDAFRLGFLGYLLNFVSVGSVGGDLFKAVFIAKEQHGRRTEAVATVIIDRLIGMYALFLMAATAVLATDLDQQTASREIELICRAVLAAASVGTVVVLVLLVPAMSSVRMIERVRTVPVVGKVGASVIDAVRIYRSRLGMVVLCGAISLGAHASFTTAMYLISQALPGKNPTLAEHFVIIPIGMAAGGLPLPLGGLGALEFVIDFLYRLVSRSSQGLVVALSYRCMTVVIAMIGAGFYLTSRREVATLMHDAEASQENRSED